MNELTERQKFILTLVIHEHIHSADPVGSNSLVKKYNLGMSSATVRNEMAALTDLNYLRQPYISAGRVPTEEGYRYFVGHLPSNTGLPDATRHTISHQFYQMHHDIEQWMRLAVSVLADQTSAAALVTLPHPDEPHIKHLELISTHGSQVLMVLVMVGGQIHQRFFTLTEPAQQEHLSTVAERITKRFSGKGVEAIREGRSQLHDLELNIIDMVIEEMQLISASVAGEIYTDGLTNVLSKPEFADSEEARRALHVLEEHSFLQDLLVRSAVLSNNIGGVQVLIGGEGTWDELRQFSIVLARYGSPGLASGALGVLGPIRMPYGRSISTVRFLSGLLSDLVSEVLVD